MSKKAVIIGAGPAGLTAAYELLKSTDIKPVILEKSGDIGGISKTINYKGNRMDIGGHRFFSKSDRVMNWWLNIMPIQKTEETYTTITYQRKQRTIVQEETYLHANSDNKQVMLVRKRLSRIYFLRKFFTYPIQLSFDTLRKLGLFRTLSILLSYLYAQLIPRKPEKSLEDFLINRFGRQLYLLFFKDYTEKVWGVPCNEISAEWGAQRIKGVSISKAIQHAAQTIFKKNKKGSNDISQKDTETSLIEQFLYPALGPGQLWEEVARQIEVLGGIIIKNQDVKAIDISNGKVNSVVTINSVTGEKTEYEGDYFFSTMPVQELIAGINGQVPEDVQQIAAGLQYRDFITVGVLLEKLSYTNRQTGNTKSLDLKDTWIYIQEKDVKVGRLQLFNNWSPYMVNKPGTQWVGMEYFCNENDEFWSLSDEEIKRIAVAELEKMGLAQVQDVLDSTVHRVEKTYPAYFGTYNQFDKVRSFVDQIENLFLVGRNGMHKYNNADHSMLTAMTAVDNIRAGITGKENIWAINTEQEYHEEKASTSSLTTENTKKNLINKYPKKEHPSKLHSFKEHLFKKKVFLFIALISVILLFIGFKFFYPQAGFISGDSYVYIKAAYFNLDVNTYPIGYSKFLRLFSVFFTSDTALVAFQYLFIQFATFYFLFTFDYFYRPGKIVFIILFTFFTINPVFFYLSNYVSSDSLFLALSLLWLTQLLWIVHAPSKRAIFWHALILLLAFMVRYNALYYPFISMIAFLLSKQKKWIKIVGIASSFLLITGFMTQVSHKYYKISGTYQFSPFSGWQIINNALYAYRYVDSKHTKKVSERFQQLDQHVRTYFDTTRDVLKNPQELLEADTWYMWDPHSPLQKYMEQQFKNDSTVEKIKRWATVAPLYADYGSYLIKQYPLHFTEHFLWPNALKYYTPPVEFLSSYNMGLDSVSQIGRKWFGYSDSKVTTRLKDFKVSILDFYPILSGILNITFLAGLLGFISIGGFRLHPTLKRSVILITSFWMLNFCFSVFASPITLRFQIFPLLLTLSFALHFLELIFKNALFINNRL